MTRERLGTLRDHFYASLETHHVPRDSIVESTFEKVCNALESAWHRIDEAERQNLDLTAQRDAAIMDGLALTVEKDGLQIEIDRLRSEVGIWTAKTVTAACKVRELERGEYICKKCGLRKDGESVKADF